jgi:hypothetical protein
VGIAGGLGSEGHEFAKGAVARVLATLAQDQIEAAKAATQRLADHLVAKFPTATINNPPNQAATPEEIIDWRSRQDQEA